MTLWESANRKTSDRRMVAVVIALLLSPVAGTTAQAPKLGKFQQELAHTMLRIVQGDVEKNYYDPTFHGVDLAARFKEADAKIDQATSFNQVFVDIQWALDGLHDSHTHFWGPPRPTRSEYGWQMQMVGTQCLVTAVKPGSDAEKQGLRLGSAIASVDNYPVTRDTIEPLLNLFENLIPQTSLTVGFHDPDGVRKTLTLQAEIQQRTRSMTVVGENVRDLPKLAYAWGLEHKSKTSAVGDKVLIWKMPEFFELEEIDRQIGEAKRYPALILDLRGNPGGAIESLLRVAGDLFDHDVPIGEATGRKGKSKLVAKTRGGHAYTGKLIVLVDSDTASAAEIMTRMIQLEKRGTVIGDRTAGAVLEAQYFGHHSSPDNTQIVFYGADIAVDDLVMSDGQRLESAGVTPDEILLPTPADLAAGRDIVLAHAVSVAGGNVTPEDAHNRFPVLWESVIE